jgi:hypothetical protein
MHVLRLTSEPLGDSHIHCGSILYIRHHVIEEKAILGLP